VDVPRSRSHQLVSLSVFTTHSETSGIELIEAGDGYAQ